MFVEGAKAQVVEIVILLNDNGAVDRFYRDTIVGQEYNCEVVQTYQKRFIRTVSGGASRVTPDRRSVELRPSDRWLRLPLHKLRIR